MEKQWFCLKQDEDCHWYVIPIEDEKLFDTLCAEAYRTDEFDLFEEKFDGKQINGYHTLRFKDPMENL